MKGKKSVDYNNMDSHLPFLEFCLKPLFTMLVTFTHSPTSGVEMNWGFLFIHRMGGGNIYI